jgi:hypothetical protein
MNITPFSPGVPADNILSAQKCKSLVLTKGVCLTYFELFSVLPLFSLFAVSLIIIIIIIIITIIIIQFLVYNGLVMTSRCPPMHRLFQVPRKAAIQELIDKYPFTAKTKSRKGFFERERSGGGSAKIDSRITITNATSTTTATNSSGVNISNSPNNSASSRAKVAAIPVKCAVLGSGARGSVYAQNRDHVIELLLAFVNAAPPSQKKYMDAIFER